MIPSLKAKAKKPSAKRAFMLLQKSYGLKNTDQIKARILYSHIKQICRALFGDNITNRRLRETYDHQWRIVEAEETRIISSPPTSVIRRSR
jgi:hypothetical protein